MFDIGGWEFMLIIILGIVIIGPTELPNALRNITMWIRRARGLAREFQSGIDDIVQEAEFEKIRQDVMDEADPTGMIGDIKSNINQALDPDGEINETFSLDDTDNWFSDHEEQDNGPDEEEPDAEPTEPPSSEPPSNEDPSSEDRGSA